MTILPCEDCGTMHEQTDVCSSDPTAQVNRKEYLFIKCLRCGNRAKLAKNKGADWVTYEFLHDFMWEHAECGANNICVEFTD